MIAVSCHWCGYELTEPGALLFAPPDADGRCAKFHLCAECFEFTVGVLDAPDVELPVFEDDPVAMKLGFTPHKPGVVPALGVSGGEQE